MEMASASRRRDATDLERGEALSQLLLEPPPPELLRSTVTNPCDRGGQICFVCLDRPGHGQYAIRIPCLKPKGERRIRVRRVTIADSDDHGSREYDSTDNRGDGSSDNPEDDSGAKPEATSNNNTGRRRPSSKSRLIYWPIEEWEKAIEDDRAVYFRMVKTCFRDLGRWKRWLPYYGVVSVNEVTVSPALSLCGTGSFLLLSQIKFDGRATRDGRFFGQIESVDLDKIRKECKEALENRPIPEDWNGFEACDGSWHTEKCMMAMEYSMSDCLAIQADRAEDRLKRMGRRYLLTTCARDPDIANGLDTLSGMAQKSCIYPTM